MITRTHPFASLPSQHSSAPSLASSVCSQASLLQYLPLRGFAPAISWCRSQLNGGMHSGCPTGNPFCDILSDLANQHRDSIVMIWFAVWIYNTAFHLLRSVLALKPQSHLYCSHGQFAKAECWQPLDTCQHATLHLCHSTHQCVCKLDEDALFPSIYDASLDLWHGDLFTRFIENQKLISRLKSSSNGIKQCCHLCIITNKATVSVNINNDHPCIGSQL